MRNFGGDYLENYNDGWGTYIRMICLSVILLEGGFELEFSAEGALSLVILLTLVPFTSEAMVCAGLSKLMMGIPLPIALTLGF